MFFFHSNISSAEANVSASPLSMFPLTWPVPPVIFSSSVSSHSSVISIMPIIDLQKRLGLNLDNWLLLQSGQQPFKMPARCHAFEKEWVECSHGIGATRAKKECLVEFEDFYECMHREKTVSVRVWKLVFLNSFDCWVVVKKLTRNLFVSYCVLFPCWNWAHSL